MQAHLEMFENFYVRPQWAAATSLSQPFRAVICVVLLSAKEMPSMKTTNTHPAPQKHDKKARAWLCLFFSEKGDDDSKIVLLILIWNQLNKKVFLLALE